MRSCCYPAASPFCMSMLQEMSDLVSVFGMYRHLQGLTVFPGLFDRPAFSISSGLFRCCVRNLLPDCFSGIPDRLFHHFRSQTGIIVQLLHDFRCKGIRFDLLCHFQFTSPFDPFRTDPDRFIFILHVINKRNIIKIPTEPDAVMLTVQGCHLAAVPDNKIQFRLGIQLLCCPVFFSRQVIGISSTGIHIFPDCRMVSDLICFHGTFLERDPVTHQLDH